MYLQLSYTKHFSNNYKYIFTLGFAMKSKTIVLIVIGVIVVLLLGVLGYGLSALKSVKVNSFTINEFGVNDQLQFAFDGVADVYNPSFLSVDIESINYTVILDPTDDVLFTGTVDGQTLKSKSTSAFEFHATSNWAPQEGFIQDMRKSAQITMTIYVDVHTKLFGIIPMTSHKKITKNVASMIQQAVERQMSRSLGQTGTE